MSRPSDPLLEWLRKHLATRNMNTASVAEAMGVPRARVRRLLAGAEPMLVDELLQLGKVLDLQPGDVGLPAGVIDEREPDPTGGPQDVAELGADPFGNQPEQIFRFAFALGCDFMFVARADDLEGSGLPKQVLAEYRGRDIPIKLEAAYHKYNAPQYDEGGITLTLSFDDLYDCRFPWPSVGQFIFYPQPEPSHQTPAPPDEKPGRPVLRLVK